MSEYTPCAKPGPRRRRLWDSGPVFNEDPTQTFERQKEAVSICRNECGLIAECLAQGMNNRESGIWGGQLLHNGTIQKIAKPRCVVCARVLRSRQRKFCSDACYRDHGNEARAERRKVLETV